MCLTRERKKVHEQAHNKQIHTFTSRLPIHLANRTDSAAWEHIVQIVLPLVSSMMRHFGQAKGR